MGLRWREALQAIFANKKSESKSVMNPQHLIGMTFMDSSEELSALRAHVGPITALTIAGFLAQFGTFRTATQALSLGALVSDSWTGDLTKYDATTPTDDNSQRERKWRVQYQDTVDFSKYNIEIPCAKVAGGLRVAGTDKGDFTAAAWIAWIAAFEAMGQSPNGNPINVIKATLVGRNL